MRDISNVKQEIINFRKVIRPQRSVLRDLENVKQRFLAPDIDLEIYFDDIVDAHERIWDMLENYKEVIEALEETNESVISHRVNDILRVLTAISVIVLPLTLIASIWGMNVGVPGEGDDGAFYAVVGAMLVAAGHDAGLVPPPRLAVANADRSGRVCWLPDAVPDAYDGWCGQPPDARGTACKICHLFGAVGTGMGRVSLPPAPSRRRAVPRLVLVAGDQVAVAVERDLDIGVAHVGRERLGVHPRGDHQGGEGVASFVKPERVHPSARLTASCSSHGIAVGTAVRAVVLGGGPRPFSHGRRRLGTQGGRTPAAVRLRVRFL